MTLYLDTMIGKTVYYTLYVDSVMDTSGNIMNMDSVRFLNYVQSSYSYHDVRLNELMPDPTPSVGLPEKEYVELFNTSKNIIDLDSWTYY